MLTAARPVVMSRAALAVQKDLTGVVVDREHLVEKSDLEELADVLVRAYDCQLSTDRPQSLDSREQHAEDRRVDEGGRGQIDHDALMPLCDDAEQLSLQLGCDVE